MLNSDVHFDLLVNHDPAAVYGGTGFGEKGIIMPVDDRKFEQFRNSPNARLLSDSFRLPVEQAVSAYYGKEWIVNEFKDMNEFASHPSAILSDGRHPVFVKLSEAAHGLDQFEVELAGLSTLHERAGVLTPALIGKVLVEGGVILILEGVQAVERTPRQWREIGLTLARIHQIKGEYCGYDQQGYFGPLYQDNRPMDNWLEFFIERRIWPRLIGAIDSGNLTTEIIRQVEKIIQRLPSLDIPEEKPSLLHGDAQQNNFISTEKGAVVIDPAVYYGHPEMDLAYLDHYQEVPDDVFIAYQEVLAIEAGFHERRDLWRIPAYLAGVEAEGKAYLSKLAKAIKRYL